MEYTAPPPNKGSFLVSLLSVLLLVTVVIAIFFAYQSQKLVKQLKIESDKASQVLITNNSQLITSTDPTLGWKTYSNKLISFRYPADWKISVGESNHEVINLIKEDEEQSKVIMPGDTEKIATYTITISLPPNTKPTLPMDVESYTVGGLNGIKYDISGSPSSGLGTRVYVEKSTEESYLFEYIAMAHEDTHYKYINIFDQILSTFEFTQTVTETVNEVPDMKTYLNLKYGFSFDYPADTKVNGDFSGSTFTLIRDDKVVTVMIGQNNEKLSVSDHFLKQISPQDPQLIAKYVNFINLNIGNNKYVWASQDPIYFKNQTTGLSNYLISTQKDYVVNFNVSGFTSLEDKNSLINQILSTFKLTN